MFFLQFCLEHYKKKMCETWPIHCLRKTIREPKKSSWFWLIDLNSMLTHVGLFYAKRFGNCVHHTFIFTFFFLCSCFLRVFCTQLHDIRFSYLIYNYMISNNCFYLIIIICLHTVIWFYIVLFMTNNHQLNQRWDPNRIIAQLAGAVEYTDCFSAEGWDPSPTAMSVLDRTLNNLMVRFQ